MDKLLVVNYSLKERKHLNVVVKLLVVNYSLKSVNNELQCTVTIPEWGPAE